MRTDAHVKYAALWRASGARNALTSVSLIAKKGALLMLPRLVPKQNELNRLTKAISELYRDISAKIGVSESVFDIFYAIAALGEGCCQKDICTYAFTSKQTIHSAIRKLEAEDFICMKPKKGREMAIFLTAKGQAFMEEKISPVIDAENCVFTQMGTEESDLLLRLTRNYLNFLRSQFKERILK